MRVAAVKVALKICHEAIEKSEYRGVCLIDAFTKWDMQCVMILLICALLKAGFMSSWLCPCLFKICVYSVFIIHNLQGTSPSLEPLKGVLMLSRPV